MLKPHPSVPLEYWFFKVNYRGVALLVDWICRRRQNSGSLRISIHSPVGREVRTVAHPAILRHGAPELAMSETSWPRGDVRWHFTLHPSAERIQPQLFPAEQLSLFDMSLISAPTVTFNGWVEHRGERYTIVDARGMVAHYWGRRLPRDWWWISVNQFESVDISVECMVLHSRLWGSALHLPLGYLYYRNGFMSRLMISPPARVSMTGGPKAIEIEFRELRGKPIALTGVGREYASLGDGIINTLTGDLSLSEGERFVAKAIGTAGLEHRSAHGQASG